MTDHVDETRGARIDLRAFLKVGLALPILGAPRAHQIGSQVNWFTLLIKVQVDLPERGAGSFWLPMAIDRATPYQRTLDQWWTANSKTIDAIRDQRSGLSVLHASWRGGEGRAR